MAAVSAGHVACGAGPLHAMTRRFEADVHQTLRAELPMIARLAEGALTCQGWRHPELLPQLHLAVCLLKTAVNSHFDREEALLYPCVRLLEDGVTRATLNLHALVPELVREHYQIEDLVAQIRLMTHEFQPPSVSPLLSTLYDGLARLASTLHAHFRAEERELFPAALSLQPRRGRGTPGRAA
jgi:iron-sulfur cluster repair protein YtfE (RIC family)